MAKPVIQPSLMAGEISPQLYSRVDLTKFHTACALARNFFVDYRGGLSNRTGTKFIQVAKGPSRLIGFKFSTIQNYVLEFGQNYIRFYMNGGPVLEGAKAITGITQANPAVVTSVAHGYVSGDWVVLTAIGGMTQLNNRTFQAAVVDADHYQLFDLWGTQVNSIAYGAYTAGGQSNRVYMISSPYNTADLSLLKFTQSADVMTLVHPSYAARDLTRSGHTAWTLTEVSYVPTTAAPTGLVGITNTPVVGGQPIRIYIYSVTAVKNGVESEASTGVIVATQGLARDVISNTLAWGAVSGVDYYNIYKAIPYNLAAATTSPAMIPMGYIGSSRGNKFVDTDIFPDFSIQSPQINDPFAVSPIIAIDITAQGAGYSDNSSSITITDGTGTGALAVPVVNGGAVNGAIVVKGGKNYSATPTITFAGGGAGATATAQIGPATGTFPSVVSYFQQRRSFAATTNSPSTVWLTKTGGYGPAYSDMSVSNPIKDNDAIEATLASLQVNAVRHMVPTSNGLLVFTSDSVWVINGGGQKNITPTSINAEPQSYGGISDIAPTVIGNDILYIQEKGNALQNINFNIFNGSFTSVDISVLSYHLLYGFTISGMAYSASPFKLLLSIRDDGKILPMTFVKEQEIIGWTAWDTDGLFESVCSIPEGIEDAVYVVVQRTLHGVVTRCVERFASRELDNTDPPTWLWFLDCALQYSGPAVNTVVGLEHLEGRTVSLMANGTMYSGLVVTNRQVTFVGPASTQIIVGLPFTTQFKSLPFDIAGGRGTVQSKLKKISQLDVFVEKTSHLKMGPAFDRLRPSKITFASSGNTKQGTYTNGLFSGIDRVIIDQDWSVLGQLCIQSDPGWPVTIGGIVPWVLEGDTEKENG